MCEVMQENCSWSKTFGKTDFGQSDSPRHGLHINSLLSFVYDIKSWNRMYTWKKESFEYLRLFR